jgi:hypothetical protein
LVSENALRNTDASRQNHIGNGFPGRELPSSPFPIWPNPSRVHGNIQSRDNLARRRYELDLDDACFFGTWQLLFEFLDTGQNGFFYASVLNGYGFGCT